MNFSIKVYRDMRLAGQFRLVSCETAVWLLQQLEAGKFDVDGVEITVTDGSAEPAMNLRKDEFDDYAPY